MSAADREIRAGWVVARVEHARAAVEAREMGQIVKTKDGNIINNRYLGDANRQALFMVRVADKLGLTPSARATLGIIDESG